MIDTSKLPKPSPEEMEHLRRARERRDELYDAARKQWPGYKIIEITSIDDVDPIFVPGLREEAP